MTEHEASRVETLDEVKTELAQQLKSQAARIEASNDGQQKIQALTQGKLNLNFSHSENVSLLSQNEDISPNAIKQIFATNISKLPAYTGSIDSHGNFVIYKISAEVTDQKLEEQNQKIVEQLGQADSNLLFGAYLGSLRAKYDVSYKTDRLTSQSN